jgi:hypothetical protein
MTERGEYRDPGALRLDLIVHNTIRDLASSDNIGIQDLFRAIVEDRQRTCEICADVAAASAAGRNCLVLTRQSRSQIATLCSLGM